MSNAVSALQGVSSAGFATVTEAGLRGMITLRGDHNAASLRQAVTDIVGVDMPEVRRCTRAGERAAAWMSPDELLIMLPYADAPDVVARLSAALEGMHGLAVNMSDARAVFMVEGTAEGTAREVLAKLAPVDMSGAAFTQGMFRRTRLAQAAVAFGAVGDDAFELICFRSEAQYVFDLLSMSAKSGSQVGVF